MSRRKDVHRHLLLFQCPRCFKRFPTRHNLTRHCKNCESQLNHGRKGKPLSDVQKVIFVKLQVARRVEGINKALRGWEMFYQTIICTKSHPINGHQLIPLKTLTPGP
ncbi:hypothetical protein BDZ91DRAFT_461061 [Kalaharituber pfeilii]|nr:hypothetical protein BDZ91DRAFT_461061 [Kalaharituber pfeilii]